MTFRSALVLLAAAALTVTHSIGASAFSLDDLHHRARSLNAGPSCWKTVSLIGTRHARYRIFNDCDGIGHFGGHD
jgi:hypothetical protein